MQITHQNLVKKIINLIMAEICSSNNYYRIQLHAFGKVDKIQVYSVAPILIHSFLAHVQHHSLNFLGEYIYSIFSNQYFHSLQFYKFL